MECCSLRFLVYAGLASASLLPACKSTNSGAQSIPVEQAGVLTLDQWTTACQRELDNPTTGAASRKELLQLAKTSDCASAYGVIKQIVAGATHKSS